MAQLEHDSFSGSAGIPNSNLGDLAPSLSEDDDDELGLDKLVSDILEEVDQVYHHNPHLQQLLDQEESSSLNAEEYFEEAPQIEQDNDDDTLPMLPPLHDSNTHAANYSHFQRHSTTTANIEHKEEEHEQPAATQHLSFTSPLAMTDTLPPNDDDNGVFGAPAEFITALPSFPMMKQQPLTGMDDDDADDEDEKVNNAESDNIAQLMFGSVDMPPPQIVPPFVHNDDTKSNANVHLAPPLHTQPQTRNAQKSNNSTRNETDPIKEIEDLLIEMDEDENGSIDLREFEEAIGMIDNTIIQQEIESMYDLMCGSNPKLSPLADSKSKSKSKSATIIRKPNGSHHAKLLRDQSTMNWKKREVDKLQAEYMKQINLLANPNANELTLSNARSRSNSSNSSASSSHSSRRSSVDKNDIDELKISVFIAYLRHKYKAYKEKIFVRFVSALSVDKNDIDELKISVFVAYLRHKYKAYKEKKNVYGHNKGQKSPHSMLKSVISDSVLISQLNANDHVDKKQILRIAFPDILLNEMTPTQSHNAMEVTTTKLWGFQKTLTPLQRLEKELKDEADDSTTMDFPEFKSSMSNFGVQLEEEELHRLFEHFIRSQSVSVISKQLHKRKELNIAFFIKYIGEQLDNEHQHMQPRQILDVAFRELLENGMKSRKNILAVHANNVDLAMSTPPEGSPNPYYDDSLMQSLSRDFAPDQIKKFEHTHSVKNVANGAGKGKANGTGKGVAVSSANTKEAQKLQERRQHQHKLVRLDSFAGWKKKELEEQENEMTAQLFLLAQQHQSAESHHDMAEVAGTTPKIGVVREDEEIID
eukprot:CAMPEP_0197073964 /NCGR_PEP_ID=MMETSP1384-20130603/210871_1 /TAXON_ID=29189 /ORGANISM="Ammonia sp." /LENGTH=814 /DNA_ID=CAMNT_0042512805 /DNA_START=28 /DNA_END=2473 /DNA_ORIENTATION=-